MVFSAISMFLHQYWIMIASFIIHWLAFIPSFFYRTEKYYDFIGMIAYLSCVALSLILIYQSKGIIHTRALIVSTMVVIWTVRLGTFLFKRIKHEKEDKRFKDLKNSFSGFLFAWTISGAWVFITASNAFTMTINNYNSIKMFIFILEQFYGYLVFFSRSFQMSKKEGSI